MRDEELIAKIASKDHDAFNAFYLRFKDSIFNTALGYLQNEVQAEELTQDVFVKIYRAAHTFKANSKVRTWVYRITVNACLSAIKMNKRLKLRPSIDERIEFEHPGIILENKENAAILFKAIDTLPTNQKTAFILTYVEGLPQKEVAEIMNIGLKAVESRLQRAKQNLRNRIKKWM